MSAGGSGWDVFISHASEDKDAVARPLAHRLRLAGLAVWLDEFELRVGDSLFERIDDGLRRSRFGVVVFSPAFLAKKWGVAEVRGLFALETPGRSRILPVWHEVDAATMTGYSPILADRYAVPTSAGLDHVADEITRLLLADPEANEAISTRLVRRLAAAVDGNDGAALADLLTHHPDVLQEGAGSRAQLTAPSPFTRIDAHQLLAGVPQTTTGLHDWTLWVLLAADDPIVCGRDPSPAVAKAMEGIGAVRRDLAKGTATPAGNFSGLNSRFQARILAGRRRLLDPGGVATLQELSNELVGVNIRTYDSLLERAVQRWGVRP